MDPLEFGKLGRQPFLKNPEQVESLWGMGGLWQVIVNSEETCGRFSLMEQLIPNAAGPGPHRHAWSDELVYILDGEIAFLLGDEISVGGRGATIFVPRNTRHAFRVDSESARILNFYSPGGWESSARINCIPAQAPTLPPAGLKMEPKVDRNELWTAFGHIAEPGPDPLRS